ncbi:MAG: YigZ family protein [Oscillospiraceae bacterium]|jgi:uncharacterized YigZ family protein|nr:YigZ family protein [Oscillospiraceae bacterium]
MEFFSPSRAGASEITEKRSRFLGRVLYAPGEDGARAELERARAEHRAARHHPWCYVLPDGSGRASDDGEPSGTSGPPMLELLRRENIRGAVCVVTRYFGGALLGPGGLIRAYTAAAMAALRDSAPKRFVTKTRVRAVCSYRAAPRIKSEISAHGGTVTDADYAESVTLEVLLEPERAEAFRRRVAEITAGQAETAVAGAAIVPAGV